jgi:hypothetical protein
VRDLLKDTFKRAGLKIDNKFFLENGFYTLQGILIGIALNDIWRILNLPGNNAPLSVGGQPSPYTYDWIYQIAIGGALAAAQVLFKVEHGIAMGTGVFMGSTWSNMSEAGNYIGFTQSQKPQTTGSGGITNNQLQSPNLIAQTPGGPGSVTLQGPYGQPTVNNTVLPASAAPIPLGTNIYSTPATANQFPGMASINAPHVQ